MTSLSTYSCFCNSVYDEDTRKPCSGKCEHTMCLECVNGGTKDCPLCDEKDAFADVRINYQMIEMILALRDKIELGFLKHEADNLTAGRCSVCKEETAKLRVCVDCCTSSKVILKDFKGKWVYQRDLRLLFGRALCSSCACDNHKDLGHTVILMEEIVGHSEQVHSQVSFDLVEKALMFEKTMKKEMSHYDKSICFYKSLVFVTKQHYNLPRLPPIPILELDFKFKFKIQSELNVIIEHTELIYKHKAMLHSEVARYEIGWLREKLTKNPELRSKLQELEDVCKQLEEFSLNGVEENISHVMMVEALERHVDKVEFDPLEKSKIRIHDLIMAEIEEIAELSKKIISMQVANDEVVALKFKLRPLMEIIKKRLAENPSSRRHELFPFSEHEFLTKVLSFFEKQETMAHRKLQTVVLNKATLRLRRDLVELLLVEHFRFDFDEPNLGLESALDARLRELDMMMLRNV